MPNPALICNYSMCKWRIPEEDPGDLDLSWPIIKIANYRCGD